MLLTHMRSSALAPLALGLGLSLGLATVAAAATQPASKVDFQPGNTESKEVGATRSFLKEGHLPKKDMPDMKYVPQYARPLYSNLNPKQLTQAQLQGLKDAQHILKHTPLIPADQAAIMSQPWAQALGKRGAGIANATLAADRASVLKFLGFKPQNADKLFYFVSFSMPKSMLRAYAEQAMWDGGILVFKGPLPHVQLSTFITKDLQALVGGKGASATITIDPRLYSAFHITMAPTVVYSTLPENLLCRKVHLQPFSYDKKQWTYPVCDKVASKYYWKIEGAVTSQYALRQFKKAGAPGVTVYLKALARGGLDSGSGKTQVPFKGSWASAPSPEQLTAIEHTVASFGNQTYQTPFGIGVGPKQPIQPGQGVSALATGPQPVVPGDGMAAAGQTVTKNGVTYRAP